MSLSKTSNPPPPLLTLSWGCEYQSFCAAQKEAAEHLSGIKLKVWCRHKREPPMCDPANVSPALRVVTVWTPSHCVLFAGHVVLSPRRFRICDLRCKLPHRFIKASLQHTLCVFVQRVCALLCDAAGAHSLSACLQLQVPALSPSSSSWSWDREEDRRRQEKWQEEQERLLQVWDVVSPSTESQKGDYCFYSSS